MEVGDQIKVFQEFIEKNYYAQLLEIVRKGDNFLVMDFFELTKFNPELAEELLEAPEEVLKAGELAVREFDLPKKLEKFYIRFRNLPESQKILVSEIRSKHLAKFLWLEGMVRQKSDVRPHVMAAKFECPSCGNILTVVQSESKFREPSRCGCGRKGKFKELSKDLVDAQGLVLEEAPEDLEGGTQPKRMNVFLKNDLVSPISEKKTAPGNKVRVMGWVTEVPINLKTGGKSIKFDLIIEANYIEPIQEDFNSLVITEEEIKQIEELSRDPKIFEKLVGSIAPSIYGYDQVKEALLLQLVGGTRKERSDGMVTRGDMHILLIGDPGAGKCIAGDTKICLEDGSIKKIEEMINSKKNEKVNILNKEGKVIIQKYSKTWKRRSPKKLLQIKTQTGKKIILTKDHPLFTTENGFIFARKASEFEINDFIATVRKIKYKGKIQKLNFKFKKSNSNNQQKLIFPKILDKDLSRLLGYLIGDGYVSRSKTSGWISFVNNNLELIKDFSKLIKKKFGGKITLRKRKSSWESYILSTSIINFLDKLSPGIVVKSLEKNVPQIISRSKKEVIKEFISALFECETHINLKKRQLEFTSISKELTENLRINLLKFGISCLLKEKIKCAINTKNKRKVNAYELIISGKEVRKYSRTIGFISEEKKNKLNRIDKDLIKNNTNLDVVPNLKEILKIIRTKFNLHQKEMNLPRGTYLHYELGDRNPSRESLQKIVSNLKKINGKDKLIILLNEIAYADIFWDKIKEIKEIGFSEKFVYDFQIDFNHNFVANGFVVHNSQLLKRIAKVAPKGRYVSGKGASAAGLTAAVVRDEFLGGWSLEAGALVLANKGFCMIDELDKMSKEDTSAMHEALEQQSVSISKANIQATLRAETTVLAAANPKFGRFDPYGLVMDQIDLPPTLINRFDLIFPIKDLPSREKDERMASHILMLHQNPDEIKADIDTKVLKKYIAYARQKIRPEISSSALEEIKEYYIKMRNSGRAEEGGTKSIPITARQLEALIRLAEASAKVRLSDKVVKKDAQRAIDLINYCLSQVAKDMETGIIDIDRISSGIPAKERSKISMIREIVDILEGEFGKTIPMENVIERAEAKGMKVDEIEDIIEKLRRTGDLFEPRRGFIQKL